MAVSPQVRRKPAGPRALGPSLTDDRHAQRHQHHRQPGTSPPHRQESRREEAHDRTRKADTRTSQVISGTCCVSRPSSQRRGRTIGERGRCQSAGHSGRALRCDVVTVRDARQRRRCGNPDRHCIAMRHRVDGERMRRRVGLGFGALQFQRARTSVTTLSTRHKRPQRVSSSRRASGRSSACLNSCSSAP
jgi:hypothetical protein